MALAITSSANIADNDSTYDVIVSGKSFSGNYMTFEMRVRGVLVASTYSTGTAGYFTGVTKEEIWANAVGQSLTGAVVITAYEWLDYGGPDEQIIQTATKTGDITITYRLTGFGLTTPTTSNKINLDLADPTNIAPYWTRPDTAFYGRFLIQVGNKGDGTSTSWTTVFTSVTYTTGVSLDPVVSGFNDEAISAMAGVSPKDIRIVLYSRFRTGSSSYTDLSGTQTKIVAGAWEKIFVTPSDVSINDFTIDSNLATNDLPYSITVYSAGATNVLTLYVNGVAIKSITGSAVSGSFTFPIDPADITTMLNNTGQVNTCSAYIKCVSTIGSVSAEKNSASVTATIGSAYVPAITAQSFSENTTSPDVATLIGKYVKLISTIKFLISGNVNGSGSRLKQAKLNFDGQTKTIDYTWDSNTTTITNAQLITGPLNNSGTNLVATLTLTDHRDRSVTYTWNTIEVLNYQYPSLTAPEGLDVVRANSDGTNNAIGVFMKVLLNASVSSLINGTQKNRLYFKIGYKVSGGASYTYYAEQDSGGISITSSTLIVKGTAGTQEFAIANSYDIIVEIRDVLTSATPTLATDLLPYGKVAMMWGPDWVSIGKIYGGSGALDVGGTIYSDGDIVADGEVLSGGKELIKRFDFLVTDFNAINPTSLTQGRVYTFNTGFQALNRPLAANYYSGILFVHNISQKYATIMMTGTTDGYIYTRLFNGTSWGNWSKVFTDLTDGPGSGLDADTIDGEHAFGANGLINGTTGNIGATFIGAKAGTTSMATAVDTLIGIDTTDTNTNSSIYSISGGGVKVAEAGVYSISLMASISSGQDNCRMLVIVYVNGVSRIYAGQATQTSAKITRCMGTVTLPLSANDVITSYCYHDSGVSKTCNGGINGNFINVTKVG